MDTQTFIKQAAIASKAILEHAIEHHLLEPDIFSGSVRWQIDVDSWNQKLELVLFSPVDYRAWLDTLRILGEKNEPSTVEPEKVRTTWSAGLPNSGVRFDLVIWRPARPSLTSVPA